MAKTSKSDIQEWLGQKFASQGKSSFLAGIGLFALGSLATLFQFGVICLLIKIVAISFGGLSFWPVVLLGIIFTALLFVGNQLSSSNALNNLTVSLGSNRSISTEQLREVGYGALDAFTSFEDAAPIVKFVMLPLFMGPRVIAAALGMIRQSKALQEYDPESSGRVLNSLIRAGKKIEFAQIGAKFEKLNLEKIVPQLMLLDGVDILKTPPAGLTIAPSLVDEFSEWLSKRDDMDD